MMTAADKKKNHTARESKPPKRWTILCMSKSEQTLSRVLSKALHRSEVWQSPARASITAKGLILLSDKDLNGKIQKAFRTIAVP